MKTILVESTDERRIRITPLAGTPDNAPRKRRPTSIGRLIQMYGSKLADYGDETMGASDLGAVVDMAIARGDKVLMMRIKPHNGCRLSLAANSGNADDPWDTTLAGVYIVPANVWDPARENHLLGRIQSEIDEVNAWLNR